MIRGWCPSVHAPMPSGDGLLVRVKPFGGRISAAQLRALTDAVQAYANGVVELTSHGNLQIRGVHAPEAFATAMLHANLAEPDPAREARRNVIALPPYDDALIHDVEDALSTTTGLPPKFCLTVQGSAVYHPASCQASILASTALHRFRPTVMATQPAPAAPPGSHLLYLPLSQTDAPTLAHLASLAPAIRTTPWRAFLSPVLAPGFLTAPPSVIACPGAPSCSSGTVPARADAGTLTTSKHIHISGCAKGCAYPHQTATLVGRNGRYDLIRHGRASDPPDRTGLTFAEAVAAL